MNEVLSIYTIYEKPLDFPNGYVVRRWSIVHRHHDPVPAKEPHAVCQTLDEARQRVPRGMYRLPRESGDDSCIVESWI